MANSNGWGDGASNNLIGWGQGADNAIGWGDSHLKSWAGLTDIAGFDTSSISYFNATGITGATQQDAIDNLIRGLKDDGIWSKMRAIYPFVTDQRNLASFSESFTNGAGWGVSGMTRSENVTTAPNGTLTADRITTSANANNVIFSESSFPSSGATHTNSVYLKYNNAQWVTLEIWTGTAQNGIRLWVDVQNGVLGTANATTGTYVTSSITNVGDGWYRVSVTGVVNSGTYPYIGIRHVDGNGAYNFTAVSSKSTFVWGAQSEIGSLTDYQPQLGSAQAVISSQFKFNLVNPVDSDAAFRLVFNGGWTHSSLGATPNGTNGFADTKLLGNTHIIKGNFGFGIYSRTNSLTNGAYGVGAALHIYPRFTDTNSYYRIFNNSSGVANGTSLGLFSGFNDSTNTSYAWFNAVKKQTLAAPLTISSVNLMLAGNVQSTGGYDNRQLAFAFASEYLNDTEVANLYAKIQAYQTALNRQV